MNVELWAKPVLNQRRSGSFTTASHQPDVPNQRLSHVIWDEDEHSSIYASLLAERLISLASEHLATGRQKPRADQTLSAPHLFH